MLEPGMENVQDKPYLFLFESTRGPHNSNILNTGIDTVTAVLAASGQLLLYDFSR